MNSTRQYNSKVGGVVLGGDFQGLGTIRSLAENKVPVYLIDHEWGIARYSMYIRGKRFRPDLLDDEKFVQILMETGRKEGLEGWILYPNNDEQVKLLSRNKDILEEFFIVPLPSWDVVEKFYMKSQVSGIAKQIGIPVPLDYRGGSLEEILDQKPVFPLVLKPVNKEKWFPLTKLKALRVNNENELKQQYLRMAEILDPYQIIIQELVVGGTQNLYSYATLFKDGSSLAGLSAVRLRQHPMDFGKATTYAVSKKVPLLEKMATQILGEIGFYGIAEVEFMRDDKDGKLKFLEINGRPWGWHTLLKASGLNLPYLLYLTMTGSDVPVMEGREDVKWVRLITDIPTVFQEVAKGRMTLKDYVDSMKGDLNFAVLSAKDPVPFFTEILLLPYLWWKRGF